jgi:hypothetical protein
MSLPTVVFSPAIRLYEISSVEGTKRDTVIVVNASQMPEKVILGPSRNGLGT